jgi:hypothetical protein
VLAGESKIIRHSSNSPDSSRGGFGALQYIIGGKNVFLMYLDRENFVRNQHPPKYCGEVYPTPSRLQIFPL